MSESIVIPVGQALQALQVLQRMATVQFPVAMHAYRIGRVIARLQMHPDLMAADEARATAVRKFGAEKDGQISVAPDRIAEFSAQYGPIAVLPVSLEVPKLPVAILEHAPPMTPADMMALEPFLEGDVV